MEDKDFEKLLESDRKIANLGVKRKKINKEKIIIPALFALALFGIGLGVYFFNPFSGATLDSKAQTNVTAQVHKVPWYLDEEKKVPVDYDSWERHTASVSMSADLRAKILKTYSHLSLNSNFLPSEESGYTSDSSKALDENKLPNPDYAYWTKEVFLSQSADILERFVNPIYGNWLSDSQDKLTFKKLGFNLFLSPDYSKKMSNVLYVDTGIIPKEKDYPSNRAVGAVFYGKITDNNTDFYYHQKGSFWTARSFITVDYKIYLKDKNVKTITKHLVVDFVPNTSEPLSPQRVLVSKVSVK